MTDAQMFAEFYALRRRYGTGEMDWDDPDPPPDRPWPMYQFWYVLYRVLIALGYRRE
jgi:hypothetical protein